VGAPLLSGQDVRKRAEHQRHLSKRKQKKRPLSVERRPPHNRYGAHTAAVSIVPGAFWACMSKRMNFSGAGNTKHDAALDSHRIRCAVGTVA
jgi:hypothetical protein